MANALIVADMERGFMSPEGSLYCGDAARAIIRPIQKLVAREHAAGSLIVFMADTHAPDDKEFLMWPAHCIAGTPDTEIVPELAGMAAQHVILPKRRYSAFFETDLAQRLAAFAPEEVIVVGDCTDICVLYTVADLRYRDYPVWVPGDCVATFDPDAHAWALRHIKSILGARIDPLEPAGAGEEA